MFNKLKAKRRGRPAILDAGRKAVVAPRRPTAMLNSFKGIVSFGGDQNDEPTVSWRAEQSRLKSEKEGKRELDSKRRSTIFFDALDKSRQTTAQNIQQTYEKQLVIDRTHGVQTTAFWLQCQKDKQRVLREERFGYEKEENAKQKLIAEREAKRLAQEQAEEAKAQHAEETRQALVEEQARLRAEDMQVVNDVATLFGLPGFDFRHEQVVQKKKKHAACAAKTALPGHVFVYIGSNSPLREPSHCLDEIAAYVKKFPMARDVYRKFPDSFDKTLSEVNCFQLGPKGCIALGTALASGAYSDLKVLNLGWNKIKFEGARALARALESGACAEMLRLGLQANHLGDESMEVISKAFVTAHEGLKLTHINLNQNVITDKGMGFLGSAIFKPGTLIKLEVLSVEHNRIEEAGAKHVSSAIKARIKEKEVGIRRGGKKYHARGKRDMVRQQTRLRLRGNRINVSGNARLVKRFAGIVAL